VTAVDFVLGQPDATALGRTEQFGWTAQGERGANARDWTGRGDTTLRARANSAQSRFSSSSTWSSGVKPNSGRSPQDRIVTLADSSPTGAPSHGIVGVSSISACSFSVVSGAGHARQAGESDDRLFAVAAWREAPYFTDAERAALALTEAVTRLSDRADPVPDEIWDEAARHYDERGLGALILAIATVNVWNRLNVTTRQVAGQWAG